MSNCVKGSEVADRLVAACTHVSARFKEGHDWVCASCIAKVIDALALDRFPLTVDEVAAAEVAYGDGEQPAAKEEP